MTKISGSSCLAHQYPARSWRPRCRAACDERHYGVVELTGDDGHKGIGLCYVGSGGGRLFSERSRVCCAYFARRRSLPRRRAVGFDVSEALLQGRAGTVVARSALWTRRSGIACKSRHLPLYKYLGGSHRSCAGLREGGYYLEGRRPICSPKKWRAIVAAWLYGRQDEDRKTRSCDRRSAHRGGARAHRSKRPSHAGRQHAWSDLPTALRFARSTRNTIPILLKSRSALTIW